MSGHGEQQPSGRLQEGFEGSRADLGVADVTIDLRGETAVVRVSGEIDLYTRGLLRDVLDECVASLASRVVVDLRAAHFIDTGGLSLMEQYARKLDDDNRTLSVSGAGDFTLKLMEILSIDGRLRVESDDRRAKPDPRS